LNCSANSPPPTPPNARGSSPRRFASRPPASSNTPDTNFLENGLNSLRALELTQRLTTLTGIEIPLVAVLEHPTPAALGHHMVDTLTEAAG
jgi:aryl carrier-like protein